MVDDTQNYWVFGLFPSSQILGNRVSTRKETKRKEERRTREESREQRRKQ
jgi:hypothetical protein